MNANSQFTGVPTTPLCLRPGRHSDLPQRAAQYVLRRERQSLRDGMGSMLMLPAFADLTN